GKMRRGHKMNLDHHAIGVPFGGPTAAYPRSLARSHILLLTWADIPLTAIPKLTVRVRFSSPAPHQGPGQGHDPSAGLIDVTDSCACGSGHCLGVGVAEGRW